MTQEEKAKRYDEIIEKANKMHSENCETCQMCIEELIPELKEESGDERIRKALIDGFTVMKESKNCGKTFSNHNIPVEDILSWLEKQGKQKPKFRVGDTIKCKYDDRQFTIKSVDLDKETYTYTQEGCGNDIDYADEEFELVEQKSAWSGEDDEHLERILKELENQRQRPLNSPYLDKIESDYNWLKSLKDRVQPQPKQGEQKPTWSDDFEEEMDRYIEENFYGSADNGFFSNRTKRELEVEDVVRIGCHFAAWQKEQSDKELSDKLKQEWSEEDEKIWNKAKQIFPESLNMQSGYVTGYKDAFKHFSLKKE